MHRSLLVSAILIVGAFNHAQRAVAAPVSGPTQRTALVFGARIHYVEAGAGPTIILVHGLGDDAGVWQAETLPLASRHHVVALHQIGFGRSDKPLLNYRVETFVDFLDEFMSTLHMRGRRSSETRSAAGSLPSSQFNIRTG